MSSSAQFNLLKCCVIIPTYNNELTLAQVITDVKEYTSNIILVNDGSTDSTSSIIAQTESIESVSYQNNKGKGYAIRQGIKKALSLDYEYAITIDSDGQHYAKDLPTFIEELKNNPNSLLIGSRFMEGKIQSKSSGFANKFSNFWFRVETGIKLPDTQSGFRLYPIKILKNKKWFCNKYEFEIEIIVRAAWAGIEVKCVPIDVFYPSLEERITHFRPFKDFFRISILNTVLVTLAFLFYLPRMMYRKLKGNNLKNLYRTHILSINESNSKIAAAIGFGIFMGIMPVWGYQLLLGFIIAHWLKLNKAVFFVAANISLPPIIPGIIYLSYVMGSFIMGNGSWQVNTDLGLESIGANIKQYLMGAVGLAMLLGTISYGISFLVLSIFRKKKTTNA